MSPFWSNFLHFHAVFGDTRPNNRLVPALWSLSPLGNPRFATFSNEIFHKSHLIRWIQQNKFSKNLQIWPRIETRYYLFRYGSRIPRRRRRQPSREGANIQFCQSFRKNCMKLRTFWSVGGHALGAPPRSGTALSC